MLAISSIYSGTGSPITQLTVAVVLPYILYCLYSALRQPKIPAKAPPLVKETTPILGSIRFFSARWDFFRTWLAKSSSFSFLVGNNHVIAVSGDAGRAAFFESRDLHFGEGYTMLSGGSGNIRTADGEDFSKYFSNRLIRMLKGGNFVKNLPSLITDVQYRLKALGPTGITDPFTSVYEIVFQLTMRTVGCNEVAENPELLERALRYNETIEQSGTMAAVMFPWFPSPALIRRTIAGAKMYRIFDKIVKERKKTGRREDDSLQFMIDEGDSVRDIISLVIGALFAGLLNSGINAAWILVYLGQNPEWMSKVREEIRSVAAAHSTDPKAPLVEQLASLPGDVWETAFPLIDLCLRDSIRLQMVGAAMRKNVSGHDVKVGDAIVPNGAYAMYPVADIHHDPEVYRDSEKWDPSRYLPDRAEDKKKPYAWLGWGVARHPCLGMRFAKLENNIITAFFLAMFDYELVNAKGEPLTEIPREDMNGFTADKPKNPVHLKYTLRS